MEPLPRSIVSLLCHFVSNLFTHTGLSPCLFPWQPLLSHLLLALPQSPPWAPTSSRLLCYEGRRGWRKASVASCLRLTQGHIDSFVIRSSTRTGSLASDVRETQPKFQLNYICSQPEQLWWQMRSLCWQFLPEDEVSQILKNGGLHSMCEECALF